MAKRGSKQNAGAQPEKNDEQKQPGKNELQQQPVKEAATNQPGNVQNESIEEPVKKKAKAVKSLVHLFVVNNSEIRMFTDQKRAEVFAKDFHNIINQTRTFNSVPKARTFKNDFLNKKTSDSPSTPDATSTSSSSGSTPGSAARSPENINRLSDVRRRMMKNAPKNKIMMHWMTTTSCGAFFAIIRFYNRSGYDQW